jgi:hypothetical protein
MIAFASQQPPARSRRFAGIDDLAPAALRAELARLLALGALRALWRNVARPVAKDAESAPGAPATREQKALAALAPAEPACGNTRARAFRPTARGPETER